MRAQSRFVALDGLRGLAALLVVIGHTCAVRWAGPMGVAIFFGLSGFLIGGILMDTTDEAGWAYRFYLRRTARIWPLYFVVVALLLWSDPYVRLKVYGPVWSYLTFLCNFPLGNASTDTRMASWILWSIAVEEQFYVLLPWVVRYVNRKELLRILIAIAACSAVLRVYFAQVANPGLSYTNSFSRLDGLSLGAAAAWLHRERPDLAGRIAAFGPAALAFLIGTTGSDPWRSPDGYGLAVLTPGISVASAVLVLSLTMAPSVMSRALSWRPLVYLGTISFGLYLLHPLVIDALEIAGLLPKRPTMFLVVLPLSVAAASVSWYLFERPILEWARKPRATVEVRDQASASS